MIKEHLKWLANPEFFFADEITKSYLERGYVYLAGRDYQLRPVMVVSLGRCNPAVDKVHNFAKALAVITNMCKKYMFVNGKIENNIVLVDLNQKGLTDIPLTYVKEILDLLNTHFPCMIHNIFIIHSPFSLRASWSIIKNLLPDYAIEKIGFLEENDWSPLQKAVPMHVLEMKYGGRAPDRTVFWPPSIPDEPEVNTASSPSPRKGVGSYARASSQSGYKGMRISTQGNGSDRMRLLSDALPPTEEKEDKGFCGLKWTSKTKKSLTSEHPEDQGCLLI
eukprot:TRINITY_DN13296_c0_g1_i5.p1 TRINITY_DN13296_c0_g1~~TRINITY_DN13296_c0_g1_i5.p1  ORF type:complete len:278 (+),score=34.74 TRINITY_DN13296_c0_g1_i5:381-1214(+)